MEASYIYGVNEMYNIHFSLNYRFHAWVLLRGVGKSAYMTDRAKEEGEA